MWDLVSYIACISCSIWLKKYSIQQSCSKTCTQLHVEKSYLSKHATRGCLDVYEKQYDYLLTAKQLWISLSGRFGELMIWDSEIRDFLLYSLVVGFFPSSWQPSINHHNKDDCKWQKLQHCWAHLLYGKVTQYHTEIMQYSNVCEHLTKALTKLQNSYNRAMMAPIHSE